MPYRQNPFYQYANPGIGQAFEGLAATLFPGADGKGDLNAAHAGAYAASADMSRAHAEKYREETRGKRNENDAAISPANALAEFLATGGVPKDDPWRRNPDYKDPTPIDFNNVLTKPADTTPVASMFLPGMSANDKIAAAIQEANIRGMKLDDVLKAAGISEYLRRAGGANPDSALAFSPFAGVHAPNTQTALTTTRQDQISARDAGEDRQLEGVRQAGANSRNKYSTDHKAATVGNNQDTIVPKEQGIALGLKPDANGNYVIRGRTTVGTGQDQYAGSLGGEDVNGREKTGGKGNDGATKVSPVPVAASKRMQAIIEASMKNQGIEVTPESMSGLLAEAGSAWQTSKNPDAAADAIVQRLNSGETINGVTINTEKRILRSDKKSLQRTPGGKAPDIATVNGAPKGSTIGGNVPGKGWEVKDASGKVIGYAQ